MASTFAWVLAIGLSLAAPVMAKTPVQAAGATDETALGRFRNTHYYLALEEDYGQGDADTPVHAVNGQVLARVSSRYKRALDIEGSGKLRDGRVINYADRMDGEIRYRVVRYPYGIGVGDCPLIPFHSIAIDPRRVPLGSVVRIDETVGMLLPDGTRHDGLWRAEDKGDAIIEDRVDLFVGAGDQGAVLRRAGITHLRPLTLRLVQPTRPDSCVYLRSTHFEPEPGGSAAP